MVDPVLKDPEAFYLDLEHGRTYCELDRETDKPLLICVHGWTTASYVWKGLTPRFRNKGYRVLIYDLYGRGRSGRPSNVEHTTALFTDQLNELLGKLNLNEQKLNIVGYSMGGAIAASFVANRLNNVERLLLIAPAGMVVRFPVFRYILRNMPLLDDRLLKAVLPKRLEKVFENAAKNYPDDEVVEHVLDNQLSELKKDGYIEALLSSLKGILASPKKVEHRAIARSHVKVLAIFPSDDKTIPHPYAKWFFDRWNGNNVSLEMHDAAHAVTYTQPQRIMEEVGDFL